MYTNRKFRQNMKEKIINDWNLKVRRRQSYALWIIKKCHNHKYTIPLKTIYQTL